MKRGNNVIIKQTAWTELWQIAGKQGNITSTDILGNIYVRITGYPEPFILVPDEVELVETGERTADP